MGIICESCGRDIDALGQDNMSCTSEPLCEDCWSERQSHAVAALKRENASLRRRNESLDAMAEETAAPKVGQLCNVAVQNLRADIQLRLRHQPRAGAGADEAGRVRAVAHEVQDEEGGRAGRRRCGQAAAMPCLKDDEARGFKLPDVSVEVDADAVAEKAAKSLRTAMGQVMRMAVE